MKHYTANASSHAASHKKILFLKIAQNQFTRVKFLFHKGTLDRGAPKICLQHIINVCNTHHRQKLTLGSVFIAGIVAGS